MLHEGVKTRLGEALDRDDREAMQRIVADFEGRIGEMDAFTRIRFASAYRMVGSLQKAVDLLQSVVEDETAWPLRGVARVKRRNYLAYEEKEEG